MVVAVSAGGGGRRAAAAGNGGRRRRAAAAGGGGYAFPQWIKKGVEVRLSTFLDLPIENIGLHQNLTFVAFGFNIKHTALVLASDSWK